MTEGASKHTPGPWNYQEGSDAYTHIVRADGKFICQLPQGTTGEDEANARLISAAPELMATLQNVHNYLIGLHAYLLSCETSVIVENLESTSAYAYKMAGLCDAAIRKSKGEEIPNAK